MARFGFLFAGQGAQTVGMGRDMYEKSPAARDIFHLAGEVTGYDIKTLCFEGPVEELNSTRVSQPAILTASLAQLRAMTAPPEEGDIVAAGLSLGEYTALVAAGVLSDRDALDLVKTRGELMQKACDENPGGMISIIGLEWPQVEEIVRTASQKGAVSISNINAPMQINVGGSLEALDEAEILADKAGARKVVRLRVAGAFHTQHMASAREALQEKIEATTFETPRFPVVSNVTANYTVDPMEMKANLVEQLTSTVLWSDSMILMINDSVKSFYEFGPGNVLTGLMRRIDRAASCGKPPME